jgi:hypothetical protein
MYFKEIETDKAAAKAHNENLKRNAADRLKANAANKRKRKGADGSLV